MRNDLTHNLGITGTKANDIALLDLIDICFLTQQQRSHRKRWFHAAGNDPEQAKSADLHITVTADLCHYCQAQNDGDHQCQRGKAGTYLLMQILLLNS